MDTGKLSESERPGKAREIRKSILRCLMDSGRMMISDISEHCGYSIPTVTKYINTLMEQGLVTAAGKKSLNRGKKPMVYKTRSDARYFVGVDIQSHALQMCAMDLSGNVIAEDECLDFVYSNTPPYMEEMCSKTLSFIDNLGIDKDKISFVCFSISGRIDTNAGISHSAFNFEGDDTPLAETLSEKTGLRVIIENNTRAMTFGELSLYNKDSLKNFLLVNVNWGLGLGIVLNGEVYCGSNGYAGEFGHMNVYNNEIICHCGKKGCLETEVSGMAMQRHLTERIKNGEASILRNRIANGNELTPSDIITAINREDPLCIDIIEKMGMELGKQIANLINLFNPEAVILSGVLSRDSIYFFEAIKSSVRKFSLKLMYKNVRIIQAENPDKTGVLGACLLGRYRFADEI